MVPLFDTCGAAVVLPKFLFTFSMCPVVYMYSVLARSRLLKEALTRIRRSRVQSELMAVYIVTAFGHLYTVRPCFFLLPACVVVSVSYIVLVSVLASGIEWLQ